MLPKVIIFLMMCHISIAKIIYLNKETRLGAGESGVLDASIEYARCIVMCSGNTYSDGSGSYNTDKVLGLHGGNVISNIGSYWAGAGGIYVVCRKE